ncbi:MAG: transposase zinc-binding domain-containing protein [Candidatus Freyarchaeota archaeon]|nr:transposase zinc-binding domain-containing protein [Candidatus Jordarchaeia archaeon]
MNGGGYAVFKCPNCGCYTFAPASQKSRLCPRCGKIVKIDLLHAEIVGDARRASELVRARNAKVAPPELKKVLKEQLVEAERKPRREGARSSTLLVKVLVEHCSGKEVTLDELERLCADCGLDNEWVKEKLPQLAMKGIVFFPSPWTVKYAGPASKSGKTFEAVQTAGLDRAVIEAISASTPRAKVIEQLAERGYPPEKVDEAIDKLHRSGLIIEEKPGVFRKAR